MITVRFFAGARAAAGTSEVTVPAGGSLTDLTATLTDRYGERLAAVLAVATFLVDGTVWRDPDRQLPPGTVDVLPPFAGG